MNNNGPSAEPWRNTPTLLGSDLDSTRRPLVKQDTLVMTVKRRVFSRIIVVVVHIIAVVVRGTGIVGSLCEIVYCLKDMT